MRLVWSYPSLAAFEQEEEERIWADRDQARLTDSLPFGSPPVRTIYRHLDDQG